MLGTFILGFLVFGIPPEHAICRRLVHALTEVAEPPVTPPSAFGDSRLVHLIVSESEPLVPAFERGPFWTYLLQAAPGDFQSVDRARQRIFEGLSALSADLRESFDLKRESLRGELLLHWGLLQTHLLSLSINLAQFMPAKDAKVLVPYFAALSYLIGDPRVNQFSLYRWLIGLLANRMNADTQQIVEELSLLPIVVSFIQPLDQFREVILSREFAFFRQERLNPSFDFDVRERRSGKISLLVEVKTVKVLKHPSDLMGAVAQAHRKMTAVQSRPSSENREDAIVLRFGDKYMYDLLPQSHASEFHSPNVGKAMVAVTSWFSEERVETTNRGSTIYSPDGSVLRRYMNSEGVVLKEVRSNIFDQIPAALNASSKASYFNRIFLMNPRGELLAIYKKAGAWVRVPVSRK